MAALRRRKQSGSAPTDAPWRIRPAVPADAPALAAIERRAFGDPWSEASFREAIKASWTFGLVVETAESVVAYLIGREAAGTGEVLNLAVDPPYRRRGLARALLDTALGVFQRRGADEVFLEVRESNAAARSLYGERGFEPVGTRRAYYRNPVEDALVLRLSLRPGR
ncbi:MAG TPA: ribosomal protein S18-alanine N-acetyltransferase [Gemmatimonadales bacterium]|jgi:ribosomal-protein-alanine N-acetyltransferase|nr:ribosomal protein S18-alanine N-acetyltransferase [Gemmatimonadales bacterium]